MKQEYTIEQYQREDRRRVLELMHETFWSEKMRKVHSFNLDFWKWQYQDNPYGKAITLLAKDGKHVVGQYANIPIKLKFDGRVIKSSLVIDLMVKPAYRRKGVFYKMGESSNNTMVEESIAVSLAFPSRRQSEAGFLRKLGWFRVGDLKVLAKPILPLIINKKHEHTNIKIEEICEFPQSIDRLWSKIAPNIVIATVRSKRYLDWRYLKSPGDGYRAFIITRDDSLVGYFVLKTIKVSKVKIGLIVDMLCLNEIEIIKSMSKRVNSVFRKSGASLYLILKTKLYANTLKKAGFIGLPRHLSPRKYSLIVRQNSQNVDFAVLQDLNNWYLTFGDWDAV